MRIPIHGDFFFVLMALILEEFVQFLQDLTISYFEFILHLRVFYYLIVFHNNENIINLSIKIKNSNINKFHKEFKR